MDDLRTKLQDALKQAMVSKDNLRRDVIRSLMSAIKQAEVDGQKTLNPDEIMTVVQREVKKRRESIEEADHVGRAEIATAERAELAIIEVFLPAQLTREQITGIVRETIAQTGVSSPKEMGKLMGALMPKVRGLADGKLVNEVVKELLGS